MTFFVAPRGTEIGAVTSALIDRLGSHQEIIMELLACPSFGDFIAVFLLENLGWISLLGLPIVAAVAVIGIATRNPK